MGICESCLGRSRRTGTRDDDETSRLLGGPYQHPYGAFGPDRSQSNIDHILQQKRNDLERLCITTSHKFVDVTNFSHLNPDPTTGMSEIEKLVFDVFDPDGLSYPNPDDTDVHPLSTYHHHHHHRHHTHSNDATLTSSPCLTTVTASETAWLRQLAPVNEHGHVVWDSLALENLSLCVKTELWE